MRHTMLMTPIKDPALHASISWTRGRDRGMPQLPEFPRRDQHLCVMCHETRPRHSIPASCVMSPGITSVSGSDPITGQATSANHVSSFPVQARLYCVIGSTGNIEYRNWKERSGLRNVGTIISHWLIKERKKLLDYVYLINNFPSLFVGASIIKIPESKRSATVSFIHFHSVDLF